MHQYAFRIHRTSPYGFIPRSGIAASHTIYCTARSEQIARDSIAFAYAADFTVSQFAESVHNAHEYFAEIDASNVK